jgi:hypothetical protein
MQDGHIVAGAVILLNGVDLISPHFIEEWIGDDYNYVLRSERSGRVYRVHRNTSKPLNGEQEAQYRAKLKAWLSENEMEADEEQTMYTAIRKTAEVTSGGDFNESSAIQRHVNAHLAAGWVLLAIHQRGHGEGNHYVQTTVYILGHSDVNAPVPDDPFR